MYRMSLPSLARQLAALFVLISFRALRMILDGDRQIKPFAQHCLQDSRRIDDKFDDGNDPLVDISEYRFMLTNSTRSRTAANVFGLSQGRVGSGDLWPWYFNSRPKSCFQYNLSLHRRSNPSQVYLMNMAGVRVRFFVVLVMNAATSFVQAYVSGG